MSENKNVNEWLKDWDALQRQYFNAWSELAQKAPFAASPGFLPAGFPGVSPWAGSPFASGFPGFPAFGGSAAPASPAASMPWHEGLEQWARMFTNTDKQNETMERMIESAKAYAAMVQTLFGGLPRGDDAPNPAAWFDALRGDLGAPGGANIPGFDPATNPFAKALRDVAGKSAQGFAELPAAFAPYLEQMRKEGVSWLQVPAFGLTREHQEHYQRSALALIEYRQALREYNRLMLQASRRGYELFEQRLADRSEPGRTIDSLRALYDLWVDAAEDAYAEIALSEEFSKVYGELTNAQMRVRRQIQIEVERVSREFGMPTRTELDSLSKRVHDLSRAARDSANARQGGEPETAKKSPAQASPPVAAKPPAPPEARAKPEAARSRMSRQAAAAKPQRVPPAVVKPRPVAAAEDGKPSSNKTASFADAVAAMRHRVAGKPASRSAAARMAKSNKQRSGKKSGKKNK